MMLIVRRGQMEKKRQLILYCRNYDTKPLVFFVYIKGRCIHFLGFELFIEFNSL